MASKIGTGFCFDRFGLRATMLICYLCGLISMTTLALVSNTFMAGVYSCISPFALPLETIILPLIAKDLFGYHSYSQIAPNVGYVRYYDAVLEKYGYSHVERHLNEWSLCWALPGIDCNDKDHLAFSSNSLGMMLALQKEPVDILHFYDARMAASCNGGLFNSETRKPTNTYFAFHIFNTLYKLGTEVDCSSDSGTVYALAATNGKRSALAIANTSPYSVDADLSITGADLADAEILRIDSIYRYSPTGETVKNDKITMPPYGCAILRFY